MVSSTLYTASPSSWSSAVNVVRYGPASVPQLPVSTGDCETLGSEVAFALLVEIRRVQLFAF